MMKVVQNVQRLINSVLNLKFFLFEIAKYIETTCKAITTNNIPKLKIKKKVNKPRLMSKSKISSGFKISPHKTFVYFII